MASRVQLGQSSTRKPLPVTWPGAGVRIGCTVSRAMWATIPGLAPERVQHAQVVRLVEGALTELSELERAAVRLCDLQGVGHVEAARSLGITHGYLRVALHRAHRKLASELNRLEALAGRAPVAVRTELALKGRRERLAPPRAPFARLAGAPRELSSRARSVRELQAG